MYVSHTYPEHVAASVEMESPLETELDSLQPLVRQAGCLTSGSPDSVPNSIPPEIFHNNRIAPKKDDYLTD